MQNIKSCSQSSLGHDLALSNNTFQSNSNKYLLEESYKGNMSFGQSRCQFCLTRHIIMEQLDLMKQAILTKNQKIRELEQFIQKISKMAFTESTDTNQTNIVMQNKVKYYQQEKEPTFTKNSPQVTFKYQSNSIKQPCRQLSKSSMSNLQKSQASDVVNEISHTERQQIKNQIKRQIKKMNIEKKPGDKFKSGSEGSRESTLRNKLIQIINVLPSHSSSNSNLHSFETQSQPLQEGHIGSVNSKQSNLKISKAIGNKQFMNEESLRSTIRSQQFKKMKEITQKYS